MRFKKSNICQKNDVLIVILFLRRFGNEIQSQSSVIE